METHMKILIGYDGSADSDRALKDLAWAGLPDKAKVLIFTAAEPWQPEVPGLQFNSRLSREAARISEEALMNAETLAEGAASRLAESHPGWMVETEAVIGSPALCLIDRAEEWKPDLIILGCHGRTAIGRLLMGSVSLKVLHHSHTDVRIVRSRRSGGSRSAPRVLVAVDGSVCSDRAVAVAASRNWPAGTRIRVISALEGTRLDAALKGIKAAADRLRHGKSHKSWVEQKSDEAVRLLSSTGVRVVSVVKVGDPRIAILREALEWDADCIFLGSRGLAGIDRFMLGSVSNSVTSHAPCTVEIVRKQSTARRREVRQSGSKA